MAVFSPNSARMPAAPVADFQSMVYGFARQSSGTVTIDSVPGEGTAVTLYLPRASEGTVRGRESLSQIEIMRGKVERILVVEDDGDVRDQAVNLLLTLGYHAHPTESGQAALKILSEEPPRPALHR